ncbi:MAG: hypothetical protein NUV92_03620 [Ignavibacteria bacterium]|jgi:hypothetical protein|nr:hypothetical protein [Ignavibacteria bacterium]MDH7526591.1 hypothetical protein [Ignavibacteria bacterium]
MTLTKATQIALIGIFLAMIVELVQWGLSTFAHELLYKFVDNRLWELIWLLRILLETVPLIIFFRVLSEKQKGGLNG